MYGWQTRSGSRTIAFQSPRDRGRVRCKGGLRTGSGPRGSSPKHTRPVPSSPRPRSAATVLDSHTKFANPMRLFIVANLKKPRAQPQIAELLEWVKAQAEVVGVD